MSKQGDIDEDASHRTYTAPYTSRHPVPNIRAYEENQGKQQAEENAHMTSEGDNQEETRLQALIGAAKAHLHIQDSSKADGFDQEEFYHSENRNAQKPLSQKGSINETSQESLETKGQQDPLGADKIKNAKNTSESVANELDPRQKRKNMKHMQRDAASREVTDPITHLPILIHDSTSNELTKVPENLLPDGSGHQSSTQFDTESNHLEHERKELQQEHSSLEKLFPPPDFEVLREEFANVYKLAFTFGLGSILIISIVLLIGSQLVSLYLANRKKDSLSMSSVRLIASQMILLVFGLVMGSGLIWFIRGWISKKIDDVWENQVWETARKQEQKDADTSAPESTQWLNSLLASIWALINPDLFTSLADKLEDVMQASLPKLVRMISVEDLGQGSESIRILGIRCLPTGAAAKDVSVSGKIKSSAKKGENDRKVPGEGVIDDSSKTDRRNKDQNTNHDKETEGSQENVAEGMEAEEGDFVNIEIAFSYRASSTGKSLKVKSKNAHLYLAFYLPGGLRLRKLPSFLCETMSTSDCSLAFFGLCLSGSAPYAKTDRRCPT